MQRIVAVPWVRLTLTLLDQSLSQFSFSRLNAISLFADESNLPVGTRNFDDNFNSKLLIDQTYIFFIFI